MKIHARIILTVEFLCLFDVYLMWKCNYKSDHYSPFVDFIGCIDCIDFIGFIDYIDCIDIIDFIDFIDIIDCIDCIDFIDFIDCIDFIDIQRPAPPCRRRCHGPTKAVR